MDHTKNADISTIEVQKTSLQVEHPIAPDHFDEKYRTTRKEIWAYYACVCR